MSDQTPPADRPPSVDTLARSIADVSLPHPLLVDAARAAIEAGDPDRARGIATDLQRRMLTPVINGTGTLLHTNLGRAPMAWEQAATYSNLELDLTTGERGSRMATAPALIAKACGAEAAIVVNNCAAAVMLTLAGLAEGRGVIVSRGELVEIGGGFRIPEVMERSGARLIEVGTTNRTRLADFERAVAEHSDDAGVILQVHQSNYRIVGFTEAPRTAELASLDRPLVADIGSGLLDSRCGWLAGGPPGWLAEEPAARQTLEAGADLVTFSGDKLFGGPQAGVIAGRADLIATISQHPLARALRPGSLVLGALQATALAYLAGDGDAIPFWRMVVLTVDELRARADAIGVGTVIDTEATPGGGTLPEVGFPSIGIAVSGDHRYALRNRVRPLIARVSDGQTIVDLRTVDPGDDADVAEALGSL
ncbi:MAG: L-seryl-tRNA(Sec) selenium transferase [Acidimicrobiales bacterium]|nr:L-seryl-tRNA(Sec) selenium transferase [Acidimicrobiales bacterium]